jgi:Leucine-rich repeat (LRR) protein
MIKPSLLLASLAVSLVSCTSRTTAPTPAAKPAPAATSAPASTAVKKLEISDENAQVLQHLERYPDLEVLSISCLEGLPAIPDSIGQLTKLRELRMDNGNGCSMNPVLPETIGNLASLETLVLYGAQDPREPGSQPHQRHRFPRGMSQLKNLTYLDLGRNGLQEIPLFVRDLPKLKQLGFGWNMNLKEVPSFLTELRELNSLDLQADGLHNLPDFLNTLPKLRQVSMGDNHAITGNEGKKKELQRRFPKIEFNFDDEYD